MTSRISPDLPLQVKTAVENDELDRAPFARQVVSLLRQYSELDGLVISIEGKWGSGKTSTLALIEAFLIEESAAQAKKQPIVVHFNPWQIGDKDALLRSFFTSIATAIKAHDANCNTCTIAEEIDAYADAFEALKLVPGAEPWASLAKFFFFLMGKGTLESHREKAKAALTQLQRKVIVFIDDIDRLYPAEVYEMVRIIKAVGDLPNMRYVVAWDQAYVSEALDNLTVPQAASYLDKIVQVRLTLPKLSLVAKQRLFEKTLQRLDPKALEAHFPDARDRLGTIFHYAHLRDLFDQPRDIYRVFNTVQIKEPLLRGEVVFADILGLFALSVKAPQVFALIEHNPHFFVGYPTEQSSFRSSQEDIEAGEEKIQQAIAASNRPDAIHKVVCYLFPRIKAAIDRIDMPRPASAYALGRVDDPNKLAIALGLGLAVGDSSIRIVLRYLQHTKERDAIANDLAADGCEDFIVQLEEVARSINGAEITDTSDLCLSIARLIEKEKFRKRSQDLDEERYFSSMREDALRTINALTNLQQESTKLEISQRIATDKDALTCAAEILCRSYFWRRGQYDDQLQLAEDAQKQAEFVQAFASNVLAAAQTAELLQKNHVGFILFTLARLIPERCPAVFAVLKEHSEHLDLFAIACIGSRRVNGRRVFGLPKRIEDLEAYCPLAEFQQYARERLADKKLEYPARAAWCAALENNALYGDGTLYED